MIIEKIKIYRIFGFFLISFSNEFSLLTFFIIFLFFCQVYDDDDLKLKESIIIKTNNKFVNMNLPMRKVIF